MNNPVCPVASPQILSPRFCSSVLSPTCSYHHPYTLASSRVTAQLTDTQSPCLHRDSPVMTIHQRHSAQLTQCNPVPGFGRHRRRKMTANGLSILNPCPARLPGPSLLHQLIAPPSNHLALDELSQNGRFSCTYRALHDAAEAIARLIAKARRADERSRSPFIVPVLVPQSSLLYISLLAILKAGGAFCPLMSDTPRERIKFILKDVSAVVVLASRSLAHLVPAEDHVHVILVDAADNCTPTPSSPEHYESSPEDVAYVMYTSGSTGTPKGVCVSHDAVTQALLAHDRHIPEFSRFLQFAAPTFDVSVFEIFFPLFRGKTLITARRDELLDHLPSVLRKMNVDACELTPTVAASLLKRRQHAPCLRLLLTIGEMLTRPVVEEFGGSETRPSILWAMYGPTEATIHCTLQTALPAGSPMGSIGSPLDTVSCFVVEPRTSAQDEGPLRLLPHGEIGELAIGGYQLASGYLNRPEQTASAFISTSYGRVYLTGDRARVTPDGKLECLGRLTGGQVKLRGQRIETGEIEQSALKTPGCHGAVAAVVDANLVLFCAVDPCISEDAITASCRNWLPRFMVPGDIVLMAEFPRLPSGKVDTQRLKSNYQSFRSFDSSTELDQRPLLEDAEAIQVISSALGREVNKRMTLAMAGVDSLTAIKVASALRLAGFATCVFDVLKPKTVADLCCHIRKGRKMDLPDDQLPPVSMLADLDQICAENPGLKLEKESIEDVIPCSAFQTALLAETSRDPQLYCNQVELQVAPGYTACDVTDAICQVAAMNEVIRSGFVPWRGGFAAILSKKFDDVRVAQHFDESFSFLEPHDFLRPFRVQIRLQGTKSEPRVLFQVHHAVYDGWSMDLMLSDLSDLLRRVPLPPRPQFRALLRHQLNQDNDDLAKQFWGKHLAGWNKSPFPKLAARYWPPSSDVKTKKHTLAIPPHRVKQVAGHQSVGAQVLFQASLALLWNGVTGVQDMVLGSVTSGRTIAVDQIEEMLGPCIASLPFRADLDGMLSVGDLLRDIQTKNRAIMQHCTMPLSEIKKLAGLLPSESLYDVLMAYQESLESSRRRDWLLTEVHHLDRLETKLLLEIQPQETCYTIQATYHSSFFAPGLVDCFLQQFGDITRVLLESLDMCLESVRATVPGLSVHNEVVRPFGGESDLAAQFEATAAAMPMAAALCFCDSFTTTSLPSVSISYRELNEAANKVARYLSSQLAPSDEVLAVLMQKSPSFYTVVLGVQKAGCAYLPILPQTPEARVRTIFKQAQVKHCIVDSASSPSFSVEGVRIHNVDRVEMQSYSSENLCVPWNPSRLAYVIYTSGTTGVPKGVAVTQENIVSNITVLRSIYHTPETAEPRLLQACSQAFDVSVFEMFFAWHAGMCLCAAPNDVLFRDLELFIRQMKISHLSLTPTLASLIDPGNVPGVEFLVTAGEPMTLSVLDQWQDRLWQGYGPSETTNICSVARGYLNDVRLTNDKFLRHPKYGRIYRSGDLGRMLPDGSLIILGRLDDQIKLRGQRIATGEINSIITSTDLAVSAVTISARRQKGSPEQLVSFFVPCGSRSEYRILAVSPEVNSHLFASLLSRVPSYMVPSYLIPVSQIPTTTSGKVDWTSLRTGFEDLAGDQAEAASSTTQRVDGAGSWSHRESIIADVIAQSTKIPRTEIGRWTPFPALGVDSITAIDLSRSLSSRMADTWVSISSVLQNPSVAQLANSLEKRARRNDEKNSVKTDLLFATLSDEVVLLLGRDAEEIEEILPCTPLQEAMLSQGTGSYYNKILLRLRITADEMRAYWDEMSRRHEILRTCFVTTRRAEHPIAQVALRQWKVTWKTYDVHAPSLAGAVDQHLKCLPEPLDSGLPPLSCAILRYKGLTFFSLICHHAIYDGVAMDNLWREVEALANHRSLPPPVRYRPFLQQILNSPEDTDTFWSHHFRGFLPCRLFTRLAGAQVNQCTHTRSFYVTLSEVQGRLRCLGLSLLSACQTAWAMVLSRACKCSDVAFGSVVNGRIADVAGLNRLVAPCFNTIAMRVNLAGFSQVKDMARDMQDLNVQMIPYQFTPLRQIQKAVNCQRRALFDTLLLLQQPLKEMDDSVWTLEEDSGNMDVPFVCEVVPCPNLNSIVLNAHYDIGIVSRDVAASLADIFVYFLRQLIYMPFSSLEDKSALPESLGLALAELVPRRDKAKDNSRCQSEDVSWSGTEQKIRNVFSELSGISKTKIARDTSMFRLGLDSINAVQVASLLRQEGYTVSASEVIECATCANLARRLLYNSGKDLAETVQGVNLQKFAMDVSSQIISSVPSAEEQFEAVLPATPMQSAVLASFISSNGHNYLNMLTMEMAHDVKAESLEQALGVLQRRHPMLQTGFLFVRHREISFAMVRHKQVSTSFESITDLDPCRTFDLRGWQEDTRQCMLQSLHLPLWRAILVEQGSRKRLHLMIHHALYDAHSLDELLQGLSSLLLDGKEPNFSRVEPALAEVLCRGLQGEEAAQGFWEKHAESAVVRKFPLLTPLREETTNGLSTHETSSSMSLSYLSEAAKICGSSIQALVQAAWTRVLASYQGESSVVFGITMSGRVTDLARAAPFPCIVTIPVVASNLDSNRELVAAMMEYNVGAHKHQFADLGRIQKWLGHPATPVFDTLVVYQRRDRQRAGRRPWRLIKDEAVVDYAVSLEIEPSTADDDDGLSLRITFSENLVPQEQARLIVRQFDAMLHHLVSEPDGNEAGLFKKHPGLFSVTPASTPAMASPVEFLHQFVENSCDNQPETTALEFIDDWGQGRSKAWSYRELDLMGNRVANLLREHTRPGELVAVHFSKSPEAYFSILGILKAGCAFVALDPNAPKARKDFILRDSDARCLLAKEGEATDFEVPIGVLGIAEESLQKLPDERPVWVNGTLTPAHTCYCLYTSGTTGTPKGCEISHENAVQAMMAFQDLFRGHWDAESRWLQFAALHFDVSVLEQYWGWAVGITVVSAPRDFILDDLVGTIGRLGITHVDLTPSLARLTSPEEMPSLRVFITGGEQLKQEIIDKWGPRAVIYNAYGPTEATIGVTMYRRVPVNGRPSNIGRQFPNVASYVFVPLTERPVLRGAVGELCVSGKLVGKGYRGRPDLTRERFPKLDDFGERVYRTGDLVRILHDGCFEFLGRADDQIKLRGQRLEVGEINHAIRTGVDDVKDCATLLVRQESLAKDVLVAFMVGRRRPSSLGKLTVLRDADDDGLAARARSACLERLPAYMVPTYFLRVPHIPLSPNNKVEAKELKSLFQSLTHEALSAAAVALPAPRLDSTIMRSVIRVVSEFSGVEEEKMTASTSLFDVGVDSISVIQLTAMLRKQGFQAASPAVLLKWPVMAHLAQALTDKSTEVPRSTVRETKQLLRACHHRHLPLACRVLGVGPDDVEYIAPCSPLQQGIIFKAVESSGCYFSSFQLRLSRGVSVGRMRTAWNRTIDAHAILRSVFVNTPDGHVQVATKKTKSQWEDVRCETQEELDLILEAKRRAWIAKNRQDVLHPIELIHAHGPRSETFIIHIFHALYDGNSMRLISQYAMALYRDEEPPCSLPFVEALAYGPLAKHDHCRGFWKDHLRDWAPSPMPTLAESTDDIRGVTVSRSVPLQRLEGLRRRQNVTMQAVVLTLWTSVLQSYLGRSVTVGVILSGRSIDAAGAEGTIGPLFNTLPFFVDAKRRGMWSSSMSEAHAFGTSVMPFQHVPLKDIQRWCSGGRPLFDNLFVFQHGWSCEAAPWEIEDGPGCADYPLAFEATRADGLRLCLVSQSNYADAAVLEGMLDRFEQMTLMAEAEATMSPCLRPAEYSQAGESAEETSAAAAAFDWTEEAVVIRDQMALLARVPPEQVKATTKLLELGLDSIDAMKLSTRLKQRGIKLPASAILRSQTISCLVGSQPEMNGVALSSSDNDMDAPPELRPQLWIEAENAGINAATVETVLPPTPLQESMVAGMVQSGFQWYFNHDVLEVAEWVDMERLRVAWMQLIEASPCLRSGFVQVSDPSLDLTYCQVVFKKGSSGTASIKTRLLKEESEIGQMMLEATRLAVQGKGLRDLVQITLVTVGERHLVVVSMAHALYDGWSLALMYRHLETSYSDRITETGVSPDAFISHVLASKTEKARGFWAGHLARLRPTVLAGTAEERESRTTATIRRETPSTRSLSELTSFCKRQAISLQVLCMAAWVAVVAERTRGLDVVFGLVLSGRDGEGAEDLMFPTMSTVALRCILHGSVSGFLKYLEETVADVRAHQHYPLRRAIKTEEAFNSLFLFQKTPRTGRAGRQLLRSIDGQAAVEYPVCVEAEPVVDDDDDDDDDDRLTWRIACHAQLFSSQEVELLLGRMDEVLQFMLRDEAAAVLSFRDAGGVSICGLPAATTVEGEAVDVEPEAIYDDDMPSEEEVWTSAASAIRDVLSQVSGVPAESITLRSSLYQLGLDSISAVKVSMLLLRKKKMDLKPRELVKLSSLRQMAEQARPVDEKEKRPKCDLVRDDVEAMMPATPMQTYMLTASEKPQGGGVVSFFPEFSYRVTGTDDEARARKAWEILTDQAVILRTRFLATTSDEVPWIQAVMKKDAIRSGRVSQPLARLEVTKAGNGSKALELRLRIHHALYDGISLGALTSRLCDLMNNEAVGEKDDDDDDDDGGLSPWLLYCSSALSDDRRREFWTEYLKDAVALDFASTTNTTERSSHLETSAVKDVSHLQAKASHHGISLQSIVLAALATTLGKQDSRTPIVIGIYLANRADETDCRSPPPPTTCPTLSLVPLKVKLSPGARLVDVAQAIQTDLIAIGSGGRSHVGPWDILSWTGLTIRCFVNFLAPVVHSVREERVQAAAAICLTSTAHHHQEQQQQQQPASSPVRPEMPLQGKRRNERVSDAVQPCVDIEASIRGKALAVGVFGPSGKVSDEWAAELVAV
ncbi:hypothetical protein L249_3076 [Ophiocordyceps polyrhachis-furcata BCC 54312]|uniref:Carrier domain-containing protein n=1 Tax=Ophiocordyceps polyrhachis-furcata BCC 54312 TaxID=1330021 RepID=A0A367LRE0_9HYPO|nr:hypothetical protein L249_3076 [Ophiocordyceps polyrhachis-furcata BCC 54312]